MDLTNFLIILCIIVLVYLLFNTINREHFVNNNISNNSDKYLTDKLLVKKTNKFKKIFSIKSKYNEKSKTYC